MMIKIRSMLKNSYMHNYNLTSFESSKNCVMIIYHYNRISLKGKKGETALCLSTKWWVHMKMSGQFHVPLYHQEYSLWYPSES